MFYAASTDQTIWTVIQKFVHCSGLAHSITFADCSAFKSFCVPVLFPIVPKKSLFFFFYGNEIKGTTLPFACISYSFIFFSVHAPFPYCLFFFPGPVSFSGYPGILLSWYPLTFISGYQVSFNSAAYIVHSIVSDCFLGNLFPLCLRISEEHRPRMLNEMSGRNLQVQIYTEEVFWQGSTDWNSGGVFTSLTTISVSAKSSSAKT